MKHVNLRNAIPSDLDGLFALYQAEHGWILPRKKWQLCLKRPLRFIWYWKRQASWLVLPLHHRRCGDDLHRRNHVAKSHRRQGLGRHLIEEIEARLPATRIELVSEEDGFYKALGFSFVGNGFRLRKWNWRQTNEKNKDYISKSGKDSVR